MRRVRSFYRCTLWLVMAVLCPACFSAAAQQSSELKGTIRGVVTDGDHKPIAGATASLVQDGGSVIDERKTGADGAFQFLSLPRGRYQVTAEKSGSRSPVSVMILSMPGDAKQVELVIPGQSTASSDEAMEFVDKPNFTVAGVTDWTAVGGHGSDSILRTSESLARETVALKPNSDENVSRGAAGSSGTAATEANAMRAKAENDEKRGDSLPAVREFEQAVRLDPTEQNYFAWGSDLLLHRAVWQAEEVFSHGAKAYPSSGRMEAALGSALFAGARYDEAAIHLCKASDLNPHDAEPYLFMGKIAIVSPTSSACIEEKLARFAREQPDSSEANYFYAMAIWKRQPQPPDAEAMLTVNSLLEKAVKLDEKCADGYLQLGILYLSNRDTNRAITFFRQAITANPQFAEAHYRLGVAYDRVGRAAEAQKEFKLHDEIEKAEAARVEQERREVKQFQIVLDAQPRPPAN